MSEFDQDFALFVAALPEWMRARARKRFKEVAAALAEPKPIPRPYSDAVECELRKKLSAAEGEIRGKSAELYELKKQLAAIRKEADPVRKLQEMVLKLNGVVDALRQEIARGNAFVDERRDIAIRMGLSEEYLDEVLDQRMH